MTRAAPRIVVTQAEEAGGSLAAGLRAGGAEVFPLPTISIEPPEDCGPLDQALGEIERFDWVVFTSRHAVEAVCLRPAWEAAKERALPGLRVAAVGKATAVRLGRLGVTADLVPDTAGGASLAALMIASLSPARPSAGAQRRVDGRSEPSPVDAPDPRPENPLTPPGETSRNGGGLQHQPLPLLGQRMLWPRSDIARRELPDALRRAGAEIVAPVAYRTVLSARANVDEFLLGLEAGTLDAIAFMSPSSARNLSALLGRSDLSLLGGRLTVASVGPATSEVLRELASPADVESAAHTAEDLAATLLAYLESKRRAT